MAQELLSRWRWHLLRTADAAGGWVLLVLAGWGLALAVGLTWLQPQQAQERQLAAEVAALEARRAAPQAAVASAPADELAAWRRGFPGVRGIAPAIGRVHALAQRHGIALPQAEFRLGPAGDDALARYTIALPASADYRRLRAFVGDLLRELPGLALQEIVLRREDARSARLEARLQLVLFVNLAE